MSRSRFGWIFVAALALAGAAFLWLQCQETETLRGEIALLRTEQGELARLRAEQARLLAARPRAAEVERLRAEHTALVRMQSELDALRANVEARERALGAGKK